MPVYTHTLQGIACNLDSDAFKKLEEATQEVMGECKPYSITGSLPLVGDLQQAGFDVQVGHGIQNFTSPLVVASYTSIQLVWWSTSLRQMVEYASRNLGITIG